MNIDSLSCIKTLPYGSPKTVVSIQAQCALNRDLITFACRKERQGNQTKTPVCWYVRKFYPPEMAPCPAASRFQSLFHSGARQELGIRYAPVDHHGKNINCIRLVCFLFLKNPNEPKRWKRGRPFGFFKNGSFILIYNQIGYPAVTILYEESDRPMFNLGLICIPYMFAHRKIWCVRSNKVVKTLRLDNNRQDTKYLFIRDQSYQPTIERQG